MPLSLPSPPFETMRIETGNRLTPPVFCVICQADARHGAGPFAFLMLFIGEDGKRLTSAGATTICLAYRGALRLTQRLLPWFGGLSTGILGAEMCGELVLLDDGYRPVSHNGLSVLIIIALSLGEDVRVAAPSGIASARRLVSGAGWLGVLLKPRQ